MPRCLGVLPAGTNIYMYNVYIYYYMCPRTTTYMCPHGSSSTSIWLVPSY